MDPDRPAVKIAIVVVSYNALSYARRMLRSVRRTTDVAFEIIVVDNASTDGSADLVAETFPHARLTRLDRNTGFGAAVNRAAAEGLEDAEDVRQSCAALTAQLLKGL